MYSECFSVFGLLAQCICTAFKAFGCSVSVRPFKRLSLWVFLVAMSTCLLQRLGVSERLAAVAQCLRATAASSWGVW